ncbi:uroporphyrinogen-III C-methyltransferase [Verrucomicrobiales bacterium]|jgi:uroporphyrinogen III methyltransferase/synthase|nr:uroporphyrinogen-III C-methyltransferase [Verrucomicrobiales bacterium]MDA9923251.1 uroporphyrinogen-III C-methyltransferase [Verrucomicrobiales bacterium]MDB2497097.1 uroporphyrinogen-III C-methyltransferase [Verrucomicrobiales bacterium]MDB3940335.1 uroporphyrinogen-III C-methyltransferase [Verrucomicrobiales bacterium]
MSKGICYLVGAGPGDPGLMTLRGKECIEIADVIVYDYLSNAEFLHWAKPGAEMIYAGKKSKDHAIPQGGINELLVQKAKEGKIVTRLKGGDPLVFGRGGEEAEELREAGVPFEFVPGISSSIAGPAYAGIPVTHRDHCSQLTIFTGHERPDKDTSSIDYDQIANAPGTKVMLMGVERLPLITSSLIEAGADPDLPVALVRWATTGQHRTITGTISTIAEVAEREEFKAPAVAVFGTVVNCRENLNWFEERPLAGKRVVVTRTRKQASKMSRMLRDLGADVLEMPTIRIQLPSGDDAREFAETVAEAHTYDWIVFTSPNAVEYFFEAFYQIREDARAIGGCRIAAVGPGTAAKLKEYRMATDLMPETHVADEIPGAFEKEFGSVENMTILWPRAKGARDELSKKLNGMGAILDESIAYETVPETEDPTGAVKRFQEEGADFITFTSASTVEGFLDLGLSIPDETAIASIGPVTSAALEENGYDPDREADSSDISGLVAAVVELANEKPFGEEE